MQSGREKTEAQASLLQRPALKEGQGMRPAEPWGGKRASYEEDMWTSQPPGLIVSPGPDSASLEFGVPSPPPHCPVRSLHPSWEGGPISSQGKLCKLTHHHSHFLTNPPPIPCILGASSHPDLETDHLLGKNHTKDHTPLVGPLSLPGSRGV